MAERTLVRLEDLAAIGNLAAAFWRAARGKRRRPEVRRFESRLDDELAVLGREILDLSVPVGRMDVFRIHDPKPRTIHAPCFRERVLHHAVMAHVAPALERALVDDTFACRKGKGTLAAVRRAQEHARRFGVFAKLDVVSYFASVDHQVLRRQLRRRLKGAGTLALLDRVIEAHHASSGRGLPIGALTSQHFANLYLGTLDRLILESHGLGLVRYMDDVVVWGRSLAAVGDAVAEAVVHARDRLGLALRVSRPPSRVSEGVPLCGFRVFPDRLLLSRRRRRRYRLARRSWETAYALGLIDARTLQQGYASALAVTAHADACVWRRGELSRRPAPDA